MICKHLKIYPRELGPYCTEKNLIDPACKDCDKFEKPDINKLVFESGLELRVVKGDARSIKKDSKGTILAIDNKGNSYRL